MARRRLLVALLVPPPVDVEADTLRRAAGDPALRRIAPHVTLVPPTNVGDEEVGAALAVVRAAAGGQPGPLALVLGPAATFDPPTTVAFLAVGGEGRADLERLHEQLQAGPFARPRSRPFVPHVTLHTRLEPARRDAWVAAAVDYVVDVTVAHVQVLEQHTGDEGFTWRVLADAPLGPVAVVGRGGLPIELTEHQVLDEQVAAVLGLPPDVPGRTADAASVVVVARRHGEVVGAARAWGRDDTLAVAVVLVAAGERGTGVGTRLVEALVRAADHRRIVAVPAPASPAALTSFLRARGVAQV